jgi:hypothetical protein
MDPSTTNLVVDQPSSKTSSQRRNSISGSEASFNVIQKRSIEVSPIPTTGRRFKLNEGRKLEESVGHKKLVRKKKLMGKLSKELTKIWTRKGEN